jgi:hypothetical protein
VWTVLWGDFHWIAMGHLLVAVSSAVAPVLLWRRRELAALCVLMVAALSCLSLLGFIFSPDMLSSDGWIWFLLPRVTLGFLTLALAFIHAVARARAANSEPLAL